MNPPAFLASGYNDIMCVVVLSPTVVAALTVTPRERMVEDQAYLQVVSGVCPTVGLSTEVRTRFRCP